MFYFITKTKSLEFLENTWLCLMNIATIWLDWFLLKSVPSNVAWVPIRKTSGCFGLSLLVNKLFTCILSSLEKNSPILVYLNTLIALSERLTTLNWLFKSFTDIRQSATKIPVRFSKSLRPSNRPWLFCVTSAFSFFSITSVQSACLAGIISVSNRRVNEITLFTFWVISGIVNLSRPQSNIFSFKSSIHYWSVRMSKSSRSEIWFYWVNKNS